MTAWDEVTVSIMIDYNQFYLVDAENGEADPGDEVAEAWLNERQAGPATNGAIVHTEKRYGDTSVSVRVLASLPVDRPTADHQVELSFTIPSGRLGVYAWGEIEPAAVVTVPTGSLRCRISWTGLGRGTPLEDEPPSLEALAIEVAPGDAAEPIVTRMWPAWAPPAHEATRANGLRRYAGPAAFEHRRSLDWIDTVRFWGPGPTLPDGEVHSLYRDPATAARWAWASHQGVQVLLELDEAEADAISAQGFDNAVVFARDADGRVWSSDEVPMQRALCLNLEDDNRADLLRAYGRETRDIELPQGWGRIVRRRRDTGELAGEVERVDDDPAFFYQRWRDDRPGPTK